MRAPCRHLALLIASLFPAAALAEKDWDAGMPLVLAQSPATRLWTDRPRLTIIQRGDGKLLRA